MNSVEKSDEFGNWLLLSPFHSLLPNQVCLVGNWPSPFIFKLGPQIVAIAILGLWGSDVGNLTLGFLNAVLVKRWCLPMLGLSFFWATVLHFCVIVCISIILNCVRLHFPINMSDIVSSWYLTAGLWPLAESFYPPSTLLLIISPSADLLAAKRYIYCSFQFEPLVSSKISYFRQFPAFCLHNCMWASGKFKAEDDALLNFKSFTKFALL